MSETPTHVQCLLCGWNWGIKKAQTMKWGSWFDEPIVRSMKLGGKKPGTKGRGKGEGIIDIQEISTALKSDEEAVESQRLGLITLVREALKTGWIGMGELEE